jgi:hypothetical protein
MTDITPFARFKGKMLKDVADTINVEADRRHLSVNVLDPDRGMGFNIDVNPRRLNVYVDENFYITKFTIK